MREMLEHFEDYIKFAVDIRRAVVAGGGALRADCEGVLLEWGSRQEDIWGADHIPSEDRVRCEAMINLAPSRGNRSMLIQNPDIRARVEETLRLLIPK